MRDSIVEAQLLSGYSHYVQKYDDAFPNLVFLSVLKVMKNVIQGSKMIGFWNRA